MWLEAMCLCTMIDGEGLLTSAEDAILLAEEALDLCLDVQDALVEMKRASFASNPLPNPLNTL